MDTTPDHPPPGPRTSPSGPVFLPPAAPPPATVVAPPPPPVKRDHRPSRRPTVISIVAIALVALVVAVASLMARYADTHIAAPTRPAAAPTAIPSDEDEIAFTSDDGSGTLRMVARTWVSGGSLRPTNGNYLRVEVEIVCTEGQFDYDPYNFQAFDQRGTLFAFAEEGTGRGVLEMGTLKAGQSVRGQLAFDIPRGDVTLLMSDELEQTVTALRVPD